MPHVDSSAKVCLACLVKYFPTWRMSDLLGLSYSLIYSSAPEIDFQWWNQGVSLKGMLRKKIQDSLVIQSHNRASIEVKKLYY